MELLNTERNYRNVLRTIQNVFHKPLEEGCSKPYLDPTEMKTIFGNVGPVLEVHETICSRLEILIEKDWKESNCIGQVFIDNVSMFFTKPHLVIRYFVSTGVSFAEGISRVH